MDAIREATLRLIGQIDSEELDLKFAKKCATCSHRKLSRL